MAETPNNPASERHRNERADPHSRHSLFAHRSSEVERPVVEVGDEHPHDRGACRDPDEVVVFELVEPSAQRFFLRKLLLLDFGIAPHDRGDEHEVEHVANDEGKPDRHLRWVPHESAERTCAEREHAAEYLRGTEEFGETQLVAVTVVVLLLRGADDP